MIDILKDHGGSIAQGAFDTKAVTATILSAGSAATAITVDASPTITLNDFSIIAAIFAGTCTGIYMLTNIIINVIKIRRELKKSALDPVDNSTKKVKSHNS